MKRFRTRTARTRTLPGPFRGLSLPSAWAALAALSGLSCAAVGEERLPSPPSGAAEPPAFETTPEGIRIDRARGEIRFACAFVNPTRVLEVFACHEQGPTHETVVAFQVGGAAIYRALRAIGLRSARHWNGTSPEDFLANQGDRVLVLVRWERGGVARELPAEALLLDGAAGYPHFVRGFSVSAGARPLSEAEEGGEEAREAPRLSPDGEPSIPEVAEITLGASNRQSPTYSLLVHPTNFPRIVPWTSPPQLDAKTLGDHRALVEESVPAELVIRKVSSEVQLLEAARAADRARGLEERVPAYDSWIPIAAEIDRLKAEYEALLADARSLLASGDPRTLPEEEKRARAERGLGLLRRGRWLCAQIEERYLRLYALQEEVKAAWAERREDLPREAREEALVLTRSGVAFEPKLASYRVEIAALELSNSGYPPGERKLRIDIARKEVELLELERQQLLAEANLRHVRARIAGLGPADRYVAELFEEDARHFETTIRGLAAKRRAARTEIAEFRGILGGSWEEDRAAVLAERSRAAKELELAELEGELNSTLAEIRWARSDLASGMPDRESAARERLERALEKEKELEERIAKLRKEIEG